MKTGNVLLCVVAGAAAGTILGVLFAPGEGSSIRKKLIQKAEAQVDAIKKAEARVDAVK